jgi:DNA-binding NarL/FixJ family response regulator
VRQPRILLADDHRIFLQGLQRLLQPDFEVVGCVEDGRALLSAAERLQPDVIVADVSMPVLNGLDAACQLKETMPAVKIVFLSMHTDSTFVKEACQAGASGYVVKKAASSELVWVIRKVLKGAPFVCSFASEAVESVSRVGALTPRQREVLQLVAEGRCTKEIANILRISTKTVEFHKYTIVERLGVRTTAELTKYAVKHGLVGL